MTPHNDTKEHCKIHGVYQQDCVSCFSVNYMPNPNKRAWTIGEIRKLKGKFLTRYPDTGVSPLNDFVDFIEDSTTPESTKEERLCSCIKDNYCEVHGKSSPTEVLEPCKHESDGWLVNGNGAYKTCNKCGVILEERNHVEQFRGKYICSKCKREFPTNNFKGEGKTLCEACDPFMTPQECQHEWFLLNPKEFWKMLPLKTYAFICHKCGEIKSVESHINKLTQREQEGHETNS